MNPHIEQAPCPCPWCRAGDRNSLYRISRMWFDDKPVSAEMKAMLDEIVADAIRTVERRGERR